VPFAVLLYIPEQRQQANGDSAFTSGLYLVPAMLGLIVATMISGELIAKTGHYKIYPIIGAVITGTPMFLISRFTATTPAIWLLVLLFIAGAGIGLFVQVAVLAGQNDVEPGDLGAATGALNFGKTLGGALGAALFGAILNSGLRHPINPGTHTYVIA
jgi:MFS family permease